MSVKSISDLEDRNLVIFDFDGPICRPFEPEGSVAAAREILAVPAFSCLGSDTEDAFELLRRSVQLPLKSRLLIDHMLEGYELRGCVPERAYLPGVALLQRLISSGKRVAIASNNSEVAIRQFLEQMDLAVESIAGRIPGRPDLLKPNPDCLLRTTNDGRDKAVFIGDTATDVIAGHRVGIPVVGLAKRPAKVALLKDAGADLVVESLAELWAS